MPRGGGSSSAGATTHRSSDDDGSEAAAARPAPTSSAKKKQAGKKKQGAKKSATASSSRRERDRKLLQQLDGIRANGDGLLTREFFEKGRVLLEKKLAGVQENLRALRESTKAFQDDQVQINQRTEAELIAARDELQEQLRHMKQAAGDTPTDLRSASESTSPNRSNNAEDGGSSATLSLAALVDQFERNNRRRDQEAREQEEELAREWAEQEKINEEFEQRLAASARMGGDGAFDMQQRHELQRVKSLAVGILFGDDPDAMKILQLSENSMEVAVMAIQSKLVTKVDEDVLYSDRMTSAIQDVVWDYKRAASTTKSEGD